ncbi:MAG TPA: type II secretion system protein [Candidatus Paceibacterota bacterium]|jgi:prepilin-type N-terminal cleavage/methylation domain-containing protein|nr:type II secretion system protein [Candidatus Paceibacterota bacterium]
MHKKFTKGFTLIELLVVIAIIGILASIVLVSLNGARAKGRDAKRVADLQQFARAVALSTKADSAVAFVGCVTSGTFARNCTDPNMGGAADPSGATGAVAAGVTSTYTAGDYTITAASAYASDPTFIDWQVKTNLESGAGTLGIGTVCISSATSTVAHTSCK